MQFNRPKLRGLYGKRISPDALRRIDLLHLPRLTRVSAKPNLELRFLNQETQIIEETEDYATLQRPDAFLNKPIYRKSRSTGKRLLVPISHLCEGNSQSAYEKLCASVSLSKPRKYYQLSSSPFFSKPY